jgi:hypothetical protein
MASITRLAKCRLDALALAAVTDSGTWEMEWTVTSEQYSNSKCDLNSDSLESGLPVADVICWVLTFTWRQVSSNLQVTPGLTAAPPPAPEARPLRGQGRGRLLLAITIPGRQAA